MVVSVVVVGCVAVVVCSVVVVLVCANASGAISAQARAIVILFTIIASLVCCSSSPGLVARGFRGRLLSAAVKSLTVIGTKVFD